MYLVSPQKISMYLSIPICNEPFDLLDIAILYEFLNTLKNELWGKNLCLLVLVPLLILSDPDFILSQESDLILQAKLNDLVRDLKLIKLYAQIPSSRFQGWNLLQPGTKIISYRKWKYNIFVILYRK